MSRHTLPPADPAHSVTVGWDSGLATYFATVTWADNTHDEDDDGPLWIGASPREIPSPDEALDAVTAYAQPFDRDALHAALAADEQQEGSRWTRSPAAFLFTDPQYLGGMQPGQRQRVEADLAKETSR